MSVQRSLVLALITASIFTAIATFLPLDWSSLTDTTTRAVTLFAVALVPTGIMGLLAAWAPTPPARREPSRNSTREAPRRAPRDAARAEKPAATPTPTPAKPSADRVTGSVKWFNRTKGFGFIVCEDGSEIFVHHRSIRGEGRQSLRDGEAVDFLVVEHDKGLQADDVTRGN